MPSEAAGPVLATVIPTLIWADAISGRANATAPASTDNRTDLFIFITLSPGKRPESSPRRDRRPVFNVIQIMFRHPIKSITLCFKQILVFTRHFKVVIIKDDQNYGR